MLRNAQLEQGNNDELEVHDIIPQRIKDKWAKEKEEKNKPPPTKEEMKDIQAKVDAIEKEKLEKGWNTKGNVEEEKKVEKVHKAGYIPGSKKVIHGHYSFNVVAKNNWSDGSEASDAEYDRQATEKPKRKPRGRDAFGKSTKQRGRSRSASADKQKQRSRSNSISKN